VTKDGAVPEMNGAGIREVTASGGPRELGLQHGRAAGDLIASVYELRMQVASRGTAVPAVLDRAMVYAPFVQRYAPELLEEVRGIGEGAGIGFERAFFLQVASELEPRADLGCSSLATSMVPNGPIVAQNWDTSHDYLGKEVVLRLRPEGKPQLVMFAIAGVIGYVGQNEHGLGQVANSLYLDDRQLGLTGYFMMRKFLEARSVNDVLTWLRGVQIGSNGNYLVGDSSGDIVDIEIGGGTLRALRDHDGFPVGVCRHEGAPNLMTTASVIHELGAREMLVCQGNPCQGSYSRFPATTPVPADDPARRGE
jgi:isopenicillin-N N-acyltransferase-like protein